MRLWHVPALGLLLASSIPASAAEVFGGAYIHDLDSPISASGIERGVDLMLGYRGGSIVRSTGLQPYGFVALNSAGETHYAAAGLAWKFGKRIYLRPGLGVAVHSGSAADLNRRSKIGFSSRVLFEPELGVGVALSDRASVEASWVHMSHARLFSDHSPGIDNIGSRLNWRL